MPSFNEIDQNEIKNLKETGGKNASTIKKRSEHIEQFLKFVLSKGYAAPINVADLAKSKQLDQLLCEFFLPQWESRITSCLKLHTWML